MLITLMMAGMLCAATPRRDNQPPADAVETQRARVAIVTDVDSDVQQWTDFIVIGAKQDALKVCEALVGNELRRVYASETGLHVSLLRGCEASPLPPRVPQNILEYALVHEDKLDASLELLLAYQDKDLLQRAQRVRTRRRDYSLFANPERCAGLLAVLQQKQEEARQQANQAALQWLDEKIDVLLRDANATCRYGQGQTRSCENAQHLLVALEKRREKQLQEMSQSSSEATGSLQCVPAGGLALFSLLDGTERVDDRLLKDVIDAAFDAEMINQRYGTKHPKWRQQHQRLRDLAQAASAAATAPATRPSTENASDERFIADYLDRKLTDLELERSRLATLYAARHPKILNLALRIRALQRWRDLVSLADSRAATSE